MNEIEFQFYGMPVGHFLEENPPTSEGRYRYTPLQGPGHPELQRELEKKGPARCFYDSRSGRQLFDVLGIPEEGVLELGNFHLSKMPEINLVAWLDPWVPTTSGMEKELEKEVSPDHLLYGRKCKPIARRIDNDDVLFHAHGEEELYVVVRLTWSGKTETEPGLPETETFSSIQDWAEKRMKRDHEKYMNF